MKKLLLFAVVCIALVSNLHAQNLTLSYSGGAIANGDTIVVTGDTGTTLIAYAYVTNHASSSLDVNCRKKYLSVIPGTENTFCWGTCYLENIFTSSQYVTISAGDTVYDFSADYKAKGHIGSSYILYTFFNKANSNDSISVVVQFFANATGIGETAMENIEFPAAFPNPCAEQVIFSYTLPEDPSGVYGLTIRDVTGNIVYTASLSGNRGVQKLDVSEFANGIYFYSLMVDRHSRYTRKLVIQH